MKFDAYPWSRALLTTEKGSKDAVLAPAKHEAPNLLFPESAIGFQRFCFFSLREDDWQYTTPASIKNRTIIYPQDALPEVLKNNQYKDNLIPYAFSEGFLDSTSTMLLKHRVDGVLMTYYSMLYFLTARKMIDKIKSSGCVSRQDIYIAFSPASHKQGKIKNLMIIFEREIQTLNKKSFFEQLLQKYQLD